MRLFYLSFVLFLGVNFLNAQIREVPLHFNPVLHNASIQKESAVAKEIQELSGLDILHLPQRRGHCPYETPGVTYLLSGDSTTISIDTFGLNGNGGTLTLLTDQLPVFGTAELDSTLIFYKSNQGVTAGVDTLRVEFCRANGECEVLKYPVVVRRAGMTHIQQALTTAVRSLDNFCIDSAPLAGVLRCNDILTCPDNYDGEGRQTVYFTTYDQPDECLWYRSSGYPGTDTVCVVLCDEFNICDTFMMVVTIEGDTLSLPFFDDFSYEGPYASGDNWLDEDTYINTTLGKNPPSVGFSTFDGLDASGRPYGGGFGVADYLTSKAIDLSGLSSADNVILSFYLQPKGLGFQPRERDSMILEFRNEEGVWKKIDAFKGIFFIPLDSVPPFTYYAFGINDPAYFHRSFQFRFSNLNSREGAYGVWHLDYVLLNANRDGSKSFRDVAFEEIPNNILKRYTAMPFRQFSGHEDAELLPEIEATIFNHFNVETKVTTNQAYLALEYPVKTAFQQFPIFDPINIPALSDTSASKAIPPAVVDAFKAGLNLPNEEKAIFSVNYEISLSDQINLATPNDTVSRKVILADYFAYDDGTAERAIEANGAGSQIAVKYHANKEDWLKGVQMHFPHVNGNTQNQLFNLQIFIGQLKNEADYEMVFQRPYYADNVFDTLQGFTSYILYQFLDSITKRPVPDSVKIPAGDFYIGWQQASSAPSPIAVGYDKNNLEASQYVYYNTGGGWRSLNDLISFKGAPMIRPVFGNTIPTQTAKNDDFLQKSEWSVNLYPNPASDYLNVEWTGELKTDEVIVEIFNSAGQLLRKESLSRRIQTDELPGGVYFLKFSAPGGIRSPIQKVILMK